MINPIPFSVQEIFPVVDSGLKFIESVFECEKKLSQFNDDYVKKQPQYFTVQTTTGLMTSEQKFNPQTDFKGGIDIASALFANGMCFDNLDFAQNYRENGLDLSNKDCLCGDYASYTVEFFPNKNTKVQNSRAFIHKNLILKTMVRSDKTVGQYAKENPEFAKELFRKTVISTLYAQHTQGNHSQQEMDEIIFKHEKQALYSQILNIRNIPFIQTIENIRSFLYNTLITRHYQQIATTKEEAKKILKTNKNSIYIWSERLGYAPDAEFLITCQCIRNHLAHPEQSCFSLTENIGNIMSGLHSFLKNLLQSKKFNFYIDKEAPKLTSIQKTPQNYIDDYILMEQVGRLQQLFNEYKIPSKTNGKTLTGRKQLDALAMQGVISQEDIPLLESAIKTRNQFAHGHSCAQEQPNTTAIRIATATILNNTMNHYQNYIGNQ